MQCGLYDSKTYVLGGDILHGEQRDPKSNQKGVEALQLASLNQRSRKKHGETRCSERLQGVFHWLFGFWDGDILELT